MLLMKVRVPVGVAMAVCSRWWACCPPTPCLPHSLTPPPVSLCEEDRLLMKFDLAMKYGPCVGITRLER